jgi:hypothetical protein
VDPVVLTASPVGAVDPCLTRLGGHDLAVAWSDLKNGRARVTFRTRVNGVWSAEAVVGDLAGENRSPAIGADGQGRIHLAWLNTLNDAPSIAFTRFLYFAPWSIATRLTPATSMPGAPVITVGRNGTSHVIWPERKSPPARLWFSRFQPDSGVSSPLPITTTPPGSQGPMVALTDSAGTLHIVWNSVTINLYELHYQRRPVDGPPSPRDSVIESRGNFMEHLTLGADPSGTLHLAYVSAPTLAPQVFYKRWRPGLGWDVAVTEVTDVNEGDAVFPSVLPSRPGTVSVLYSRPSGEPRFMERRRQIEPPMIVIAAGDPAPARARVLEAGPNPVHAGAALEMRWTGAGNAREIDLYDLSGRRVASALSTPDGERRVARLEGDHTRRLAAGVYFVRPRGWDQGGVRLVVLR